MKFYCVLLFTILLFAVMTSIEARTEQVCGYTDSKGKQQFLKFWADKNEGDEYIDKGEDEICLKRATCTKTYETKVEDCSEMNVTCENKGTFEGEFPACCVKC